MVEYDRSQLRNAAGTSALKICVVGVGGAGSNVIDRITTDRTVEASLISMQTDLRVLHQSLAPKKVQLGADLMRGVGAGGDPDLGREAALFSKDDIRAVVEGHDMVFISVGLGGGTGSGAAPIVAEIAKSTGATVIVFAAVPFSFEGRRRTLQATEALERLQKSADGLILFENKRMGELLLQPKDGIQKAFAMADTLISQSVRAVTNMVGAGGIVKLGLDDLSAALRVTDGRCLFGFGEAKGQHRGVNALERALTSPLIHKGRMLRHARNLLVYIVGGESLTLAEVEVVMKQLGRHVPDDTHILFGLGVDPKLGESISVTLFSALSASEMDSLSAEDPEEAAPAPVPERRAPAPKAVRQAAGTPELFAEPTPAPEPVVPAKPPVAVAPPPSELFKPSVAEPRVAARVAPAVAAKPAPPEPKPEPVKPAPVPVVVAPEPEVVYQREEEVIEEEEVTAQVEETPVYQEPRHAPEPGIKLAEVIGLSTPSPRAEARPHLDTAVDEIEIEEQAPAPRYTAPAVLEPLPETTAIPLVRGPATTVTSRTVEQRAPTPRAPEPQPSSNQRFEPAAPTTPTVRSKSLIPPTPGEQQTFSLDEEDRGRFKDTEPAIVQGEDLDTPTWMRMRKKLRR